MRTFRLQTKDEHWWSLNDFGAVLDAMARLRFKAGQDATRRVLEFGPGRSTLALIEGGAWHIDSCEDDPDWAAVYEARLSGMPAKGFNASVSIHRYQWADTLSVPTIDGLQYDMGFIDGPLGTDRRSVVLSYCMDRCSAVLLPTEDRNPRLRASIIRIASERRWDIDIRETGELSGGFALLTRKGLSW